MKPLRANPGYRSQPRMQRKNLLTQLGERQFRKALAASKSPYKWFVPGAAVPCRKVASSVGLWSGVGFLASCPTRPVAHSWDAAAFDTGRLQIASSFCKGLWLTGIAMYGCPTGLTHPKARQVTDDMLASAVDRLAMCRGPRYLAGDFNQDLVHLPSVSRLRALGFHEVQDLHFQRSGVLPRATCRHKTQRDLLWVSSELLPFFVSCDVDHTVWVDHAVVTATFHGSSALLSPSVWPQPKPISWDRVSPARGSQSVDFQHCSDISGQYRQFWQNIEQAVHEQDPDSVGKVGRASVLVPVSTVPVAPHLKKGQSRDGEAPVLPQHWLHFHRFRQVRRLRSLVRLLSVPQSDAHREHREALWKSIVKAPGFRPSFRRWWDDISPKICGVWITDRCPSLDSVALILQVVEDSCKELESLLRSQQSHVDSLRRKCNANHIFRAMRKDPPQQVDVLFEPDRATVLEVDVDSLSVVVDRPLQWSETDPVVVAGQPLEVLHACEDQVWSSDVSHVTPGSTLVIQRRLGSLTELFDAFTAHWRQKWARHGSVPPSHWHRIVTFAQQHLPPVSAPALDFTVSDFRATVSSRKKHAAVGPDGVSRVDLLQLHDVEVESLLDMYHRIMRDGQWPQQLTEGSIYSLAKTSSPEGVRDFRPVTIFSLVYRTWSSLAAKYWMQCLEPLFDANLYGNRQGRRASELWHAVLEAMESSQVGADDVCGLVFDLHAAFNTLPRVPVMSAALSAGIDEGTLTAWSGFLGTMARRFKIRSAVSPAVYSTCGFFRKVVPFLVLPWLCWTNCGMFG